MIDPHRKLAGKHLGRRPLGCDPWMHTLRQPKRRPGPAPRRAELIAVDSNPGIGVDRGPAPPLAPSTIHGLQFRARRSRTSCSASALEIAETRVDALVLVGFAAVAWTFNIRGADVSIHAARQRPMRGAKERPPYVVSITANCEKRRDHLEQTADVGNRTR